MIDTGLNLRGIVDGAEFIDNASMGANQQLQLKKMIQNPLKVMFLKKLMSLWDHIAVLNNKVLKEKQSQFDLKLQLALTIIEEQYQLMCTIAHLFTAF